MNFHPLVKTLIVGTMLARTATSMSVPFLAIYLGSLGNIDPWFIGIILGSGALSSTFAGFLGGALSDRLGRKKIMLASLYLYVLVFIGFAVNQNPWIFLLLSILNGACRAFFEPTAQALMGDLTPADQRYRVFSARYVAANMGVAIGPMIGVYLGITAGSVPFYITSGIHVFYAVVLHNLVNCYTKPSDHVRSEVPAREKVTIGMALRVIAKDRVLLFYLMGGILVQLVYSQMTTSLSKQLTDLLVDGAKLFAWLMTTNAIVVVLLQMPISRLSEKRPAMWSIKYGNLLYGLGGLGFALSTGWAGMIASMVVFTLGEVMSFPAGTMLVDQIAPDGLRGTYYGSQNFRELGRFIGPPLGFMLLADYGAFVLFSIMFVVTLISTYIYSMGYRSWESRGVFNKERTVHDL